MQRLPHGFGLWPAPFVTALPIRSCQIGEHGNANLLRTPPVRQLQLRSVTQQTLTVTHLGFCALDCHLKPRCTLPGLFGLLLCLLLGCSVLTCYALQLSWGLIRYIWLLLLCNILCCCCCAAALLDGFMILVISLQCLCCWLQTSRASSSATMLCHDICDKAKPFFPFCRRLNLCLG